MTPKGDDLPKTRRDLLKTCQDVTPWGWRPGASTGQLSTCPEAEDGSCRCPEERLGSRRSPGSEAMDISTAASPVRPLGLFFVLKWEGSGGIGWKWPLLSKPNPSRFLPLQPSFPSIKLMLPLNPVKSIDGSLFYKMMRKVTNSYILDSLWKFTQILQHILSLCI